MIRISVLAALGLLLAAVPAHAAAPSRRITEGEAEKLVYAYLGPSGADDLITEDDEGDPPEFFTLFEMNVDTKAEHSFFVDRSTGDLWEIDVCKQDTNDGLRAAQEKLWAELGMTAKDYDAIKRRGPVCYS